QLFGSAGLRVGSCCQSGPGSRTQERDTRIGGSAGAKCAGGTGGDKGADPPRPYYSDRAATRRRARCHHRLHAHRRISDVRQKVHEQREVSWGGRWGRVTVVPAEAGTNRHGWLLAEKVFAPVPNTGGTAYGSLLSQGRRC